jgi:hypothetical protein
VTSLHSASTVGTDASKSLPSWARFVLERRALEEYYTFVRTGQWAPLPSSVTKNHLNDIMNTLRLMPASPMQARIRVEMFRAISPLHAELTRRFLEPALGVIHLDKAKTIQLAEDSKLSAELRVQPLNPEPELARLIRLGLAPRDRLNLLIESRYGSCSCLSCADVSVICFDCMVVDVSLYLLCVCVFCLPLCGDAQFDST